MTAYQTIDIIKTSQVVGFIAQIFIAVCSWVYLSTRWLSCGGLI